MTAQKQTPTTEQDVDYNSVRPAGKIVSPVFSTNDLFIKFPKPFCKMRRQSHAKIIAFFISDVSELHPDFVEYETIYYEGQMSPRYTQITKAGKVIILHLIGNMNIPFTSVRPWSLEKESLYKSLLGKKLRIVIKDKQD